MNNMNFICPTCKRSTQLDNEIIEHLVKEKDKYRDMLGERTKELDRTRKALEMALDWLEQDATPEKCDDDLCREFTKQKLAEIKNSTRTKGCKMKMKYALDNMIDIIDGACNVYMLVYVIICIIISIKQHIVPFGMLKDWFNIGAIIALLGMVFIPDRQQRKDMRKGVRNDNKRTI